MTLILNQRFQYVINKNNLLTIYSCATATRCNANSSGHSFRRIGLISFRSHHAELEVTAMVESRTGWRALLIWHRFQRKRQSNFSSGKLVTIVISLKGLRKSGGLLTAEKHLTTFSADTRQSLSLSIFYPSFHCHCRCHSNGIVCGLPSSQ